jgi:hypothetical protein
MAGGAIWQRQIPIAMDLQNNAMTIPLDKVFIKQRIDLLTAQAWLSQENVLVDEVIQLSLKHNVPCAHTKLCAFEISEKNEAAMKDAKKGGNAVSYAKYAVGGAAGVMVIGALAGADFGDVGASLANASGAVAGLGQVLGSIDLGSFDVPDFGCIADCAANAPCLEPLLSCVEPCIESGGDLIGAVGGVVAGLVGAVVGGD